MENWNPSVITEIALTEHTRRVARVDQEGWQRPARRGRSPQAWLAARLLALAECLAPALRPPPATSLQGIPHDPRRDDEPSGGRQRAGLTSG